MNPKIYFKFIPKIKNIITIISNLSYELTILIFLLRTVPMIINLSGVSMECSIFELAIIETIIVCFNSSAKAMWLVVFVNHSSVVVYMKQSFYLNISKLFENKIFRKKWYRIVLIFAIYFLNVYWSLFIEYFCCLFWYFGIFVK